MGHGFPNLSLRFLFTLPLGGGSTRLNERRGGVTLNSGTVSRGETSPHTARHSLVYMRSDPPPPWEGMTTACSDRPLLQSLPQSAYIVLSAADFAACSVTRCGIAGSTLKAMCR